MTLVAPPLSTSSGKRVEQIYHEATRIRDVLRKTENVRDEVQDYLPGLKMIRLREPGEMPNPQQTKPPE